jgi:transposase
MNVQRRNSMPAVAVSVGGCHRPCVVSSVVLVRYRYRLRPTCGQRWALARVFGCARVVYDDARRAYRSWFDSLSGRRKGRAIGQPVFRRKHGRQSIRLTHNGFRLRGRRVSVAKVGRKVRETRLDHAHKIALALIRDTQAVHAEDLAVSVHDVCRAQLLRLTGERAEQYGRTFHRIDRFTPTSQTCSTCGANDGPKPLRIRTWQCAACGAVHDRDVNAAHNVLAAGRADRVNACGGTVRPGSDLAGPGETGTHRGAA